MRQNVSTQVPVVKIGYRFNPQENSYTIGNICTKRTLTVHDPIQVGRVWYQISHYFRVDKPEKIDEEFGTLPEYFLTLAPLHAQSPREG